MPCSYGCNTASTWIVSSRKWNTVTNKYVLFCSLAEAYQLKKDTSDTHCEEIDLVFVILLDKISMATDRVHSFVIRNVKPRPSTNHPSYKPSSLMAVLRQKSRVRSMSQYLLTTLHQMKRMQTMEIALVYCYHNSNRFRNKLVLWVLFTLGLMIPIDRLWLRGRSFLFSIA